jgi:hypothetical protein
MTKKEVVDKDSSGAFVINSPILQDPIQKELEEDIELLKKKLYKNKMESSLDETTL